MIVLEKKVRVVLLVTMIAVLLGGSLLFVGVQAYFSDTTTDTTFSTNQQKLDVQITRLMGQIQKNSTNIQLYIDLSQAYLQKVRDTADSTYYKKISDLMDTAEALDPHNPQVPATRASVALGRHQFLEAKQYAKQALVLDPNNNRYYGLLGDASIELGAYANAVEAFQKMVDLRPEYSAYVRIAYIRELYGDISGAKKFLRLAISAGSNFAENTAFAYVELGKLDNRDDPLQATIDFNQALRLVPEYPTALEGLGKISFFTNDTASAEKYFSRAYTKLPTVQLATDLGDLYLHEGKNNVAEQYFTLADLAFAESEKSGIDTDLEQSLFLSDHTRNLSDALVRAERAYAVRPSVYAADYLAWALYTNGQFTKATIYEKEALRIGAVDPLILFHQGMIAVKTGDTVKAKRYLAACLGLNPRFSILQAAKAVSVLKDMSL